MPRLLLKNVTKRYGEVVAVKNLNLEVKDKEFVVMVGPSGCGKSSTLRMIAGLEVISSGEIYIGDKLINEVPPKDRNVGMVFQEYALYPHLNAKENIEFPLKVAHIPRKQREKEIKNAIKLAEFPEELLNHRPGEISGGERQRIALARAIVKHAQIFLFDEPLSNLDAKLRNQVRNDIIKLQKRLGVTTLYVTHDQTEAMTMGDRVAVLSHGIMQQVGTPAELYDHPQNKHVAGFIGSPSMNFMDVKIFEKSGGKFWMDGEGFMLKIPDNYITSLKKYNGQKVIFGIRPEDVYREEGTISSSEENTISGMIEMVEPLGTETIVHYNTPEPGTQPLACLTSREAIGLKRGTKERVILDLSKMHAFEKDTEKAII